MSATNAETAFISTSNYIYLIAIGAFVLSGVCIFFRDIVDILKKLPISFVELIFYTVFGTIVYFAPSLSPNFSHIIALPPSLFITYTIYYSLKRLDTHSNRSEFFKVTTFSTLFLFLNVVFYAIVAIYLNSLSMGYICIAALMSLVGFNVGFGPGFIAVGYNNKDVIPSATFSALAILLCGAYFKITNPTIVLNINQLFVPGMLWLGSFVYFISLLIMSSKYYALTFDTNVQGQVYSQMQFVAIVSGLFAIYFGMFFEISQLYGIAGTITTIYFVEKIYEISPKGSGIYLIFFASLVVMLINTHIRSYLLENGYENMIDTYFNLYPKSY